MSLEIRRDYNTQENRWDMVLTGEVDISNAAQLRGELKTMFDEKASTVTIDIREMLQAISEITPEQLEQAKEILKPYLDGYKITVTEDGNSSMEVLR